MNVFSKAVSIRMLKALNIASALSGILTAMIEFHETLKDASPKVCSWFLVFSICRLFD